MLKTGQGARNGLYALHAIDNKIEDPNGRKTGPQKILDAAATAAAASGDIYLQALLRYDVNIANAIVSVVKRAQHHRHRDGHAPRPTARPDAGILGARVRHRQMAADVLATEQCHHLSSTTPRNPCRPSSGIWWSYRRRPKRRPGFQMWIQKHAQHRRQFGRPDRVLRPGKHHAVPAPHPRQTLGQGSNTWSPTRGTTCTALELTRPNATTACGS